MAVFAIKAALKFASGMLTLQTAIYSITLEPGAVPIALSKSNFLVQTEVDGLYWNNTPLYAVPPLAVPYKFPSEACIKVPRG